jgi:hypothetical protein
MPYNKISNAVPEIDRMKINLDIPQVKEEMEETKESTIFAVEKQLNYNYSESIREL